MRRENLKNEILKIIVEEYVYEPKPVGSVYLINKYNLDVSSATVRNVMADLEKEKFIEKSHTSSGRIPTTLGYEYYAKYLSSDIDEKLNSKIKDIFANRRSSIDHTINEAVSIISEISKMTVVTSEYKDGETLKSIALTPINDNVAIIVIITSGGRVDSKELNLIKNIKINDLKIAIRIFQERLHNVKLSEIPEVLKTLEPILKERIKNYEELIETFVTHVFTQYVHASNNQVFGKSYIIQSRDIQRQELAHIIDLIEHQSI